MALSVGATLTFFLGGSMIWAAADAPSPDSSAPLSGTASIDANNQLTVEITSGGWVWGNTHTCSTTGGRSDRYAAGYAVDWQDPQKPGYGIIDKGHATGVDVGIQGEDRFIYYNVQQPCGHPATVQWEGKTVQGTAGSIGNSARVGSNTVVGLKHTYAPGVRPTSPICLVTYDVHGSYPSDFDAKDQFVDTAPDNSVSTNNDIPNVADRCFKINIPNPPDLKITKSVSPQSVEVGGIFTYGLAVENVSDDAATGTTTVSDNVPSTLAVQSITANGWNCSAPSNSITCTTTSTIAAHSAAPQIVVTAKALASAVPAGQSQGTVTNTGTVTNPNDSNPNNNQSTVTSTVTVPAQPQLDLGITKTVSAASAKVGDPLNYTLSVRNVSNENTTGTVTVTDTIPGYLQITGAATGTDWSCSVTGQVVTCTRPSLAKNTTAPAISVPTKVLAGAIPANSTSGTVVNTGMVSTAGDTNPNNNQDTVTTPVSVEQKNLDLAIVKSASATSAKVGDQLGYSLQVTNVSSADTTGTVTVTDTVPSTLQLLSAAGNGWSCSIGGNQAITCTRPSLAAGASSTINVSTIVLSGAVPSVTNTGVVSTPNDGNPNNNTSTVTTPVSPADKLDVAIVKTASAASAKLGDTLTYTLNVINTSVVNTTGAVTVTDNVPAGLSLQSVSGNGWTCSTVAQSISCTLPSLAAGASANPITVTTTVLSSGAPQVVNTGIVSTPGDSNPNNNQSTVTTPVSVPAPKLSIAKSAVPASGTEVFRGDSITYMLSYANDSDTAATGATITDDVPAGTTLSGTGTCPTNCTGSSVSGNTLSWTVNVPAHGSGSVSFTVIVNDDVADGAIIRNHAVMSYGGTSTNTNETQHPVNVPSGALSLVKSVDNTAPNFGDLLTYSLVVSATGDINQTGVVVTDVVPNDTTFEGPVTCSTGCSYDYNAGTNTVTWNVGTLSPGSPVTLTFATRINIPDVPEGTSVTRTIDNVGLVFSNETPTTPSNHVRTPITEVLGVKIVKTPTTTPTATLPFTGVGLPVGRAVTDGVLLVLAGMLMLALASGGRRKPNMA